MAKAADEMSHWAEYDYVIVNRDIGTSLDQLKAILTAERLKRERQVGLAEFVKALARRALNACANADETRAATESSSARAVGAMPRRSRTAAGSTKMPDERAAQHLAPLAEGGRGHLLQWPDIGEPLRRRGRGTSRITDDVTFGGGTKADGRHVEQPLRGAYVLGEHRKPAVVLAARLRRSGGRPPPSGTSAPCPRQSLA